MSSSHSSQQICRPHFHAPLHPWLSEPKALAQAGPWGFACPQEPQDKVGQVVQSSHQTGQHLFSFPPTPPKDSTPDSVQTGPAEYQVSVYWPSTNLLALNERSKVCFVLSYALFFFFFVFIEYFVSHANIKQ